jgi:hypothetical protein
VIRSILRAKENIIRRQGTVPNAIVMDLKCYESLRKEASEYILAGFRLDAESKLLNMDVIISDSVEGMHLAHIFWEAVAHD